MYKFSLWVEGHGAQGNPSPARFLGVVAAENFTAAVFKWNQENNADRRWGDLDFRPEPRLWGCRVFDNEEDARKNYG